MNQVKLIGNIGKQPDIKTTETGKKFVVFSLATSDTYADKATGEIKTTAAEWHRLVSFKPSVIAAIEAGITKGAFVKVSGSLKTTSYQGKDGQPHFSTEIVASKIETVARKATSEDKAAA